MTIADVIAIKLVLLHWPLRECWGPSCWVKSRTLHHCVAVTGHIRSQAASEFGGEKWQEWGHGDWCWALTWTLFITERICTKLYTHETALLNRWWLAGILLMDWRRWFQKVVSQSQTFCWDLKWIPFAAEHLGFGSVTAQVAAKLCLQLDTWEQHLLRSQDVLWDGGGCSAELPSRGKGENEVESSLICVSAEFV